MVLYENLFVFDYAAGMDEEGNFLGGLKSTGIRSNIPGMAQGPRNERNCLMIVFCLSKPMTAAFQAGSER